MNLNDRLTEIIDQVIKDFPGVELIEFKVLNQGGSRILRLLVDKPEGILLDECAKINKMIGHICEQEDLFSGKYNVEVCSPGLDRELKTKKDFEKVLNKLVKIKTIQPVLKDVVVVGEIDSVGDGGILLKVSEEQKVEIDFDNIKQARLEVRW